MQMDPPPRRERSIRRAGFDDMAHCRAAGNRGRGG
jgi:hypothetical protein